MSLFDLFVCVLMMGSECGWSLKSSNKVFSLAEGQKMAFSNGGSSLFKVLVEDM